MLDFKGLNQTLLSRASEVLSVWLPGGRVQGNEYSCGDLSGSEGDSLKVNINKGVWQDFATGEKGADLISLYAAIENLKPGEAAKKLAASTGFNLKGNAAIPAKLSEPKENDLVAPPDDVVPETNHKTLGWPTHTWTYTSPEGAPLFYVCRYTRPDGKKEFRPFSWSNKTERFVNRAWPSPRPIYGLDLLNQDPKAPILIVEGEKAADAARQFIKSYLVVTWPNGGKSVDMADWTPLEGRRVLIWPDADAEGIKTGDSLARILIKICHEVKLLDVKGEPDGWDAADSGFDMPKFIEWAKPRASIYTGHAVKKVEEQEPPTSLQALTAAFPHKGKASMPLGTIENLQYVLDNFGIIARYNVISKEDEVIIPTASFTSDNRANASLAWITSLCSKLQMPTGNVDNYLGYLTSQNLYNPVTTWITSKPWDKTSRLQDLYKTVTALNELVAPEILFLKEALMKRWLISAVAAAFRPDGVSAQGVLVFQGLQNLGKTSWFKSLVPQHMKLTADGIRLDPSDRDSVKQAVSFWLVELGELDATFRKSDVAQLKSFLTRDKDILRRAFARKESEYDRRTVFFGSVNPHQFLHDNTGNKRFWTVECEKIDHKHSVNMQQLWAEVHELYEKGESWYLTEEENKLLNSHNESFLSKDEVEEKIATHLNWELESEKWMWKTASQALEDLGMLRLTHGEVKKASQELFNRNGGRRRKSHGIMKLLCPPLILKSPFPPIN